MYSMSIHLCLDLSIGNIAFLQTTVVYNDKDMCT